MLEVPILFTIFNRPKETADVFAEIRKSRPKRLYIAADGPKDDKGRDACEETREIVGKVDWDCEVRRKFENKNLGCKAAMSDAINWFFENVPEGIVLEDDCLPHQDFFGFCAELLEKYRNNEKVMMISGDNFQDGQKRGEASYYFSGFGNIWGWATWKRAWRLYDINMAEFERLKKENWLKEVTGNKRTSDKLFEMMDNARKGVLDTWDFQWIFAMLKHGGLSATPNVNLVSNIGCGQTAAHTRSSDIGKFNLKTENMSRIVHPEKIERDKEADEYMARKLFPESMKNKLRRKIFEIWPW